MTKSIFRSRFGITQIFTWLLLIALTGCSKGELTERNLALALEAAYNAAAFSPCTDGKNVFDVRLVKIIDKDFSYKATPNSGTVFYESQIALPADVRVPSAEDMNLQLIAKAYGTNSARKAAMTIGSEDAVCNMVRYYLLHPCLESRDPDLASKSDVVARKGEVFTGFDQYRKVVKHGGPNQELILDPISRFSILERGGGYRNEVFTGIMPGYIAPDSIEQRRKAGMKYLCS